MKRTIITVVLTLALSAFAIQALEQTAFSGAGVIESTSGGFKFPDGSVQLEASAPTPAPIEIYLYNNLVGEPGPGITPGANQLMFWVPFGESTDLITKVSFSVTLYNPSDTFAFKCLAEVGLTNAEGVQITQHFFAAEFVAMPGTSETFTKTVEFSRPLIPQIDLEVPNDNGNYFFGVRLSSPDIGEYWPATCKSWFFVHTN